LRKRPHIHAFKYVITCNDGNKEVEFRVNIICFSEGNDTIDPTPILDLPKLSSPDEMHNVTLVVGDKKLRVSKDFLAIHSPIFSAMFFGEFAEKIRGRMRNSQRRVGTPKKLDF
ncbi:hypothetical protein PENTCL1PPCAC_24735, partial [Pristionchus entomophagus]